MIAKAKRTKKHFKQTKHNKQNIHKQTKRKHSNINYIKLNKLSFEDYKRYSRIIIDVKRSENIPVLGYWTPSLLDTLKKEGNTYIILENNKFIGLVLFHNLSESFRNKILGSESNQLRSQVDISSYLFYYTFLNKEIEKETKMLKGFCDGIINLFISNNNLRNKNFFIIFLKEFQYDNKSLDIVSKCFPLIDYAIKGVEEYKKLGFEYNGAYITMNNEIYNVFMKRYLNKNARDFNKFYPTYVITRQLDNVAYSNLEHLELMLKKDGLFLLKNVYKFCLNNSFVYYNNLINNEVYSIFKGAPYEFYFIPNYLTNELGNNHIICNYAYLYEALVDYYGKNATELNNFAKIIRNRDEVYNMLDEGKYISIRNFCVLSDNFIIGKTFNNKDKFIEYINNEKYYLPYGYYNIDATYLLNLAPIFNNYLYTIIKQILFTYIDNELKVYIRDKGGILIGTRTLQHLIENSQLAGLTDDYPKIFPDELPSLLTEPITDSQITEINDSITENCKIIAKMYKKHVANDINQINGYKIIHLYMRLIKVKGHYKINIVDTTYYNELNPLDSYEDSLWISEVAIKPALYKGYQTKEIGDQYKPLKFD